MNPRLIRKSHYTCSITYYLDTSIWFLSAYYHHIFQCYLETFDTLTSKQVSNFSTEATQFAIDNYFGPRQGDKSELIVILVIISAQVEDDVAAYIKRFDNRTPAIRLIPIVYNKTLKTTCKPGFWKLSGWPFFLFYRKLTSDTAHILNCYR